MKKHWKKLLWGGLCLLCAVGFMLLLWGDRRTVETLTPQRTAQRWETPDKPYAMASVFLPPEQSIPDLQIGEIYLSVENALTAAGVGSEDYPWVYAASRMEDAELSNGTIKCKTELTAVSGDFFSIHPMPLLDGWYIDEDDVMHDRIVLNRQAAWILFYSANVTGQYVTLNGMPCQVAAVVDTEPGRFNELAAGDTARAWVLSDCPALSPAETEGATASAPMPVTGTGYTCIEMVLPQPVKQFAAGTLGSILADSIPEGTPVTDNTGRFSLPNRWYVLRHLATRGISSEAIAYPYWENAARLAENHLALRLIPAGALLVFLGVSLIVLLVWLNRRRTWGLHSLKEIAENAVDRKHQRDYEARLNGDVPEQLSPRAQRREERQSRRQAQRALRYAEKGRRWKNR